ncbi:XRE family transcriptional regulator [Rhodococcus sp. IEGM 1379]|uniref:helix-turn-helix domain-containing protein n=1 Tax=Rhodococcus sp. IEGM 1379 TaxID=3047086 RepID=UPI0024B64586|nr:XRE family transcriptional regulator [Rhodococcus sp. IEGM 1379]MDI9914193.1 XRE family transcriptional regulator [Rhodococcus sp. IEGM 1379]
MTTMQSTNAFVGRNVKRYRLQCRLSVSELARRSGVSKTTLLALEIGESNSTIDTLQSIALALEVSLTDLVSKFDSAPPTVVRRESDEDWHDYHDYKFRAMGTIYGADMVHVLHCVVNETGYSSEGHESDSVEFICVLSGTLLAGDPDDPVELHQGDWIRYAADRPHSFRAIGGHSEAVLVMRRSESSRNSMPIEHPHD